MIDELLLQRICKQYNIKYKIFENTGTIILDSGLDEWMVHIDPQKDRPYCLMHKNKIKQTKKFHFQRRLTTLGHLLDSIASHKKVLTTIYGSSPIHKPRNKKVNKNTKYKHNKKKGAIC